MNEVDQQYMDLMKESSDRRSSQIARYAFLVGAASVLSAIADGVPMDEVRRSVERVSMTPARPSKTLDTSGPMLDTGGVH